MMGWGGAEKMERDKGERGRGVQNIKCQQVNLNKGYAESYLTLF